MLSTEARLSPEEIALLQEAALTRKQIAYAFAEQRRKEKRELRFLQEEHRKRIWLFRIEQRKANALKKRRAKFAKDLEYALSHTRFLAQKTERESWEPIVKLPVLPKAKKRTDPKHSLTFEFLPSGGRFQIGYLDITLGSPDVDRGLFHSPSVLGPFIFNVDTGETVDYMQFVCFHENFEENPIRLETRWDAVSDPVYNIYKQKKGKSGFIPYLPPQLMPFSNKSNLHGDFGRVIGPGLDVEAEHHIRHSYATGFLRESDGTINTRTIEERQVDARTVLVGHSEYLTNVNIRGEVLSSLNIFDRATPTVISNIGPLRLANGQKLRIMTDGVVNGLIVSTDISRKSVISADSGTEEDFCVLEIVGDPVLADGNFCYVPCRYTALDGHGGHVSWNRDTLASILFTSPVFDTSARSDDFATREISRCLSRIEKDVRDVWDMTPSDGQFLSAVDSVKGFQPVNINGIAYVRDALAFLDVLKPMIKVIQRPLSLKAWSQMFLFWRYGIKLTMKDTAELGSVLLHASKFLSSWKAYIQYTNSLKTKYGIYTVDLVGPRYTGRHRSNSRVTARLEVPVELKWPAVLDQLARDMDLRLNMINVWDLIPYSFVVNWFINVASILEQIDYASEVNRLSVRDWVHSARNTVQMSKTAYFIQGFIGPVRIDTYSRSAETTLPNPSWKMGSSLFANHWTELGLIIVSKAKF